MAWVFVHDVQFDDSWRGEEVQETQSASVSAWYLIFSFFFFGGYLGYYYCLCNVKYRELLCSL